MHALGIIPRQFYLYMGLLSTSKWWWMEGIVISSETSARHPQLRRIGLFKLLSRRTMGTHMTSGKLSSMFNMWASVLISVRRMGAHSRWCKSTNVSFFFLFFFLVSITCELQYQNLWKIAYCKMTTYGREKESRPKYLARSRGACQDCVDQNLNKKLLTKSPVAKKSWTTSTCCG